jgi:NMD protein affecting ribosome stability and mRNA decay
MMDLNTATLCRNCGDLAETTDGLCADCAAQRDVRDVSPRSDQPTQR